MGVKISGVQAPPGATHPRVHANLTLEAGDGIVTAATTDHISLFTADGSAGVRIRGTHADLVTLVNQLSAQVNGARTDVPLERGIR